MKRALLLATCLLFLLAAAGQAANTLTVGGNFSYPIYMDLNGAPYSGNDLGGGSIDTSYLNGWELPYLYCVDIDTTIYVPGSYAATDVNVTGDIYGAPLNNAKQVAWLLNQYGTGGQGDAAKALQAAIWHVVDNRYTLDPTQNSSSVVALYDDYLGHLPADPGDLVDHFFWITPGTLDSNGDVIAYQGVVAPTPIPSAMLLMASGVAGLVGIGRFRRGRSRK